MVNDEAGQVFQKHIDEGKSKAEATKLKDEFLKERSTELKQAKADRNELKKKQGKDALQLPVLPATAGRHQRAPKSHRQRSQSRLRAITATTSRRSKRPWQWC